MNTQYYYTDLTDEALKSVTITEDDITILKRIKNALVESKLYEEATYIRNIEKTLTTIVERRIQLGYIQSKNNTPEEKLYSHSEVSYLLEMATQPLKNTLEHYENLSRKIIMEHVAALIKENDELKLKQSSVPVQSGEITGGKKLTMKCEHEGCNETIGRDYMRKPTGSSWDNEPIFLCDLHACENTWKPKIIYNDGHANII